MRLRFCVALAVGLSSSAAVAGCGEGVTAQPAVVSVPSPTGSSSAVATSLPSPPATPPACLPKDTAEGQLAHVDLRGGALVVCVEHAQDVGQPDGQKAPCLQVDPRAGRFTSAPDWVVPNGSAADPPSTDAFTVDATDTQLTVCKRGKRDCHTFRATLKKGERLGKPEGDESEEGRTRRALGIAAVNTDGSKVFAIATERQKGADPDRTGSRLVHGDTYDVKSGKRLSRIELSKVPPGGSGMFADTSNTWTARYIGDRVRLSSRVCCGPAGAEALFDPVTGSSIDLGDPQFFLPASGSLWLLGNEDAGGATIEVVDVVKGQVARKFVLPNKALEMPEQDALEVEKLDDGAFAVVFARPPGFAIVNATATSLSAPVELPLCP
jgi:hypothetical protein